MRILQINKFFYPRGGADIHFLDVCKMLEKKGHEVIHFSMDHPQNNFSPYSRYFVPNLDLRDVSGIKEKIKVAGRVLYYREAAKRLDQLIKTAKPEVAHLHNIYHQISPSILPVLKKHNLPIVMTAHDYKLICPNYRLFTQGAVCERCKKHRYWEAIAHRCMFNSFGPSALSALEMSIHKLCGVYEKNVDCLISPSRFLRDKFREWGVTLPIEVMPNFLNPEFRSQPSQETSPGDYFLYFGRLVEEKGLSVLLAAAEKMPEVKIHLAGGGSDVGNLENKIKKLPNVSLTGYKVGDSLMQEIIGSRAVIVPSFWYENYPVSALEALSYGRPVIASAIGGLLEIVRDGANGFLFSAGNAVALAEKMRILWHDKALAEKLGQTGRDQVLKENNQSNYYQALIKLYQRLISLI